MAEILCPMCGKPNPDHLDECQFCQARLKPLLAGTPADPEPDQGGEDWLTGAGEGDELPGWLTELTQDSGTEAGEDDWLDRIRSDNLDPDDGATDDALWEESAAEQESPDWSQQTFASGRGGDLLARISEEADPGEPGQSEESEAEAPPDWLSEFVQPDPLAGTSEEPAQPDESVAAPGLPQEEEDLPDWLAELGATEIAEPVSDEDRPDWLAEFAAQTEADSEPEMPEALEAPIQPNEEEEGLWLAGFMEKPDDKTSEQLPAEQADEDWLTGFVEEDAPPAEAVPVPTETVPTPEEEALPTWLTELPGEPGDAELEPAEDALPSWLDEFNKRDAPDEDDAGEEIPNWLASALGQLQGEGEEGEDVLAFSETAEPGEVEAEAEPMPDWLADFSTGPADSGVDTGAEEMPDWLMDVGAPEIQESAEAEVPDWLQELHEKTPELSLGESGLEMGDWGEQAEQAAEETDAIDWMPGQADQTALGILAEATDMDEDLAPGEIPDWLKSMRLIDATSPGTMEAGEVDLGSVERVGPLAGLRGVLSAEPYAVQAGTPPAHTVRLDVSDSQQTRSDQLQKMVTGETEPRPTRRSVILSEQRVLRYIIAALLFLAVALPAMLPGRLSGLPAKPPEMDNLGNMIAGLTETSVVLVVFDYQPGMSGELDAAAAGVLDHIMLQQARLALVSTTPTGPALAERFVRVVEARHSYAYGTQYVNLGYVPGEASGLQFFGGSPQDAAPLAYDARPIWSVFDQTSTNPWAQPALEGINRLEDFQMTVLISDDLDTVRRWIEQAGPHMRGGSLAVIASAQIEPLVRPYFDADNGQVAALVPGLYGGAAYEGFLQREGPGRAAWDAVGIGTLLAIILILGVGTYNLFLAWKEREAARMGRR